MHSGTESFSDTDIRTIQRIIISVRCGVVLSVGVLLAVGAGNVREHLGWALLLLGISTVYSLTGFYYPSTELGSMRASAIVTTLDAGLSLGFIATTGGRESPTVALLFLVIIAAATRLSFAGTVLLSLALGVSYFLLALTVNSADTPLEVRLQAGLWWPLYLLFTAALTAAFTLLTEGAAQAQAAARAEAAAEHAAAEEERDLRARLLKSYEAQETGLQVILHELRTPIASLKALADAGQRNLPAHDTQRARDLIAAHAGHLSAMMDALGDVAASRRPTFSTGHRQLVLLHDFLLATADAVGLVPPQLRMTISPPDVRCRFDPQLLRRVITNLLTNASRHGRGEPVDIVARVSRSELHLEILDRGPGLPPELASIVTKKFVSVGDQRGSAGLGLWIADQIVISLNGRLHFGARTGGGLAVYLEVPIT
ncbi:putative two-component histidine kinase [Rhodococcus opacus RKJ300 = JCM 13270]|nr:putative two-component histidine kinase [Rhodococcus opacus RKJ300 = JCM 13270]